MFEISRPHFRLEVKSLPSEERKPGEAPFLRLTTTVGKDARIDCCLIPRSRTQVRIAILQGHADLTIQATSLDELPNLMSLKAIADELSRTTIRIGEDPIDALATAFKPFSGRDEIERRLQYAVWWLSYGLADEAREEYLDDYERIQGLLRFIPNFEVPSTESVPYEAFSPDGYYGTSVRMLIESALADLRELLGKVLNCQELELTFEPLPNSLGRSNLLLLRTEFRQSIQAWREHFETMWGPFLS